MTMRFLALMLATIMPLRAFADVTLPPVIGNGMVLQRGQAVPVWGSAGNGEKIAVVFRDRQFTTVASDGKWRVEIEPGEAGGPFPMAVRGANEIALKDVYVGDVWVIAGQSNAAAEELIKPPAGAGEEIRLFNTKPSQKEPGRGWTSSGRFPTLGLRTAYAIHEQLKIPVGLLFAAVGSTRISSWKPAPASDPDRMGGLYEQLILKVQPFRIKGVIWWQGENDSASVEAGTHYEQYLGDLIRGWRRDWGQGDFPFVFVQLQSIPLTTDDRHSAVQWTRESQRRALAAPNTGMVVTFDVTDGKLHPEKTGVCKRLIPVVLGLAYGRKEEWCGPLLDRSELKGEEVILTFRHIGTGLVAKGGELTEFEIQPGNAPSFDADFQKNLYGWAKGLKSGFVPAKARLSEDGKSVVIDAKGLTPPLRVRYAFSNAPQGKLYNASGFAASPFLTDPIR